MKKLIGNLKTKKAYRTFKRYRKNLLRNRFMLPQNIKTCINFERKYREITFRYHDKKYPLFLSEKGAELINEFVWGHILKPNKYLKNLNAIQEFSLGKGEVIPSLKGKSDIEKRLLILEEIKKTYKNAKKLVNIISNYTNYKELKLIKNQFIKGERCEKEIKIQKQIRHEYYNTINYIINALGILELYLNKIK